MLRCPAGRPERAYRTERERAGLIGRPACGVRTVAGAGDPVLARRLSAEPLFATAKVAVDGVREAARLQDLGFRVVDVGLQFEADAGRLADGDTAAVRPARPDDRDAVRDIAGRAFRWSRFHLDPGFPPALADRIKAEWAGNWFSGRRGDAMLVAERHGQVAGFLLALAAHGRAVIDLIAVAPEHAGHGLGQAMSRRLATTPVGGAVQPTVGVGTQAANTAAARFYEGLGFRLAGAGYVLHHHGSGPDYQERDAS